MSTLATNAITDASGGNTTTINGYTPTMSNMAGRNRIINGDMRIDQRNAGASVTPTNGQYLVDRFVYYSSQASKFTAQQNAGSVTPPAGFENYLGFTSTSAYSVSSSDYFLVTQIIEGLNVADLGWGTANAATVTLSFWVRSSLTGTFGGVLGNSGGSRSYPFVYTISVANTWEQKTVTIAGDTSGTWLKTNGAGITLYLGMGVGSTYSGTAGSWAGTLYLSATGATSVVGTNGATFYITGVQLEAGSVATPFEHRQYGQELALCQRYYQKSPTGFESWFYSIEQLGSGYGRSPIYFPVYMRAIPTISGLTFYRSTYNASGSQMISVAGFAPYLNGMTNSNYVTGWEASSEL